MVMVPKSSQKANHLRTIQKLIFRNYCITQHIIKVGVNPKYHPTGTQNMDTYQKQNKK